MDLYLSGPIKGIADFEERFRLVAEELAAAGHVPINPVDVDAVCVPPCTGEGDEARHYDCYMRGDLAAMMATEGVALLPGWELSRGARLEHAIALQVGLPVRTFDVWRDSCIGCGCTDADCSQCIAKTGAPCSWVRRNLCSACAA